MIDWTLKKTANEVAQEKLEKDLLSLRRQRNTLLAATDHWAYQDTPDMTEEQVTYRQALRDITDTYTSIEDVVWPEKPE